MKKRFFFKLITTVILAGSATLATAQAEGQTDRSRVENQGPPGNSANTNNSTNARNSADSTRGRQSGGSGKESGGIYRMSDQNRNSDGNWAKDHKGAYQNSTGHNAERAGSRQSDDNLNEREEAGTGPGASVDR